MHNSSKMFSTSTMQKRLARFKTLQKGTYIHSQQKKKLFELSGGHCVCYCGQGQSECYFDRTTLFADHSFECWVIVCQQLWRIWTDLQKSNPLFYTSQMEKQDVHKFDVYVPGSFEASPSWMIFNSDLWTPIFYIVAKKPKTKNRRARAIDATQRDREQFGRNWTLYAAAECEYLVQSGDYGILPVRLARVTFINQVRELDS